MGTTPPICSSSAPSTSRPATGARPAKPWKRPSMRTRSRRMPTGCWGISVGWVEKPRPRGIAYFLDDSQGERAQKMLEGLAGRDSLTEEGYNALGYIYNAGRQYEKA